MYVENYSFVFKLLKQRNPIKSQVYSRIALY